jgi:hypothetical protein
VAVYTPAGLRDIFMALDQTLAKQLATRSMEHLVQRYPEVLDEYRAIGRGTFDKLDLRTFLYHYCYVVYASGFRASMIEGKFPALQTAFRDFDPERLARMRSIDPVLRIFNNTRKANCFLTGARSVMREGFPEFKARLSECGREALQELPGIGPITKEHLAKNIGLWNGPKPDIHLKRAANLCGTSVPKLVEYVADYLGETQNVVDVAIWEFCRDGLLRTLLR